MRGAVQTPVFLVPELCNMTGLSDAQRADFNLMKDLAIYTRYIPMTEIDLSYFYCIFALRRVKNVETSGVMRNDAEA